MTNNDLLVILAVVVVVGGIWWFTSSASAQSYDASQRITYRALAANDMLNVIRLRGT